MGKLIVEIVSDRYEMPKRGDSLSCCGLIIDLDAHVHMHLVAYIFYMFPLCRTLNPPPFNAISFSCTDHATILPQHIPKSHTP